MRTKDGNSKPRQVNIKIKIYRSGKDYEYVTMHINDWYKLVRQLKKGIVNLEWERR
jgi:hypothetical protein